MVLCELFKTNNCDGFIWENKEVYILSQKWILNNRHSLTVRLETRFKQILANVLVFAVVHRPWPQSHTFASLSSNSICLYIYLSTYLNLPLSLTNRSEPSLHLEKRFTLTQLTSLISLQSPVNTLWIWLTVCVCFNRNTQPVRLIQKMTGGH